MLTTICIRVFQCTAAVVALALGPLAASLGWCGQDTQKPIPTRGAELYTQHCSGCHGLEGRGDGVAAPYLKPRPRDFGLGQFKITSTLAGSLPTDNDLFGVITRGMPGSAMPGWEFLAESDRNALVAHVKSLSKFFDTDENKWINYFELDRDMTVEPIPPAPPFDTEAIARGKLTYRRADCWKCHGDTGIGDGLLARELKDAWGNIIRPRDFTAGIFKGGSTPSDVWRRITTGVNGTPMPGHREALSDAERWDLTAYVLSMARSGAQEMTRQFRRKIPAPHVESSGDWANPAGAGWREQRQTWVSLMPLWWRDDRIEGVLIQAVHDGKSVYLRMTWQDITKNDAAVRPQDFRDGAALQFANNPDVPFLAMGESAKSVNIWMWKADGEASPAGRADVHTQYPNLSVTDYPESESWKIGEYWTPGATLKELGPRFAAGWAAGNVVSDPNVSTPVENLYARGLSTLAAIPHASRHVLGRSTWSQGVWTVVVSRELLPKSAGEYTIPTNTTVPMALAIWDGSKGDRNGQKCISTWQDLVVAP